MEKSLTNTAFAATLFVLIMGISSLIFGGSGIKLVDKIVFIINIVVVLNFVYIRIGEGQKFSFQTGIVFFFISFYSLLLNPTLLPLVVTLIVYLLLGLKKPSEEAELNRSWIKYFYKCSTRKEKTVILIFLLTIWVSDVFIVF